MSHSHYTSANAAYTWMTVKNTVFDRVEVLMMQDKGSSSNVGFSAAQVEFPPEAIEISDAKLTSIFRTRSQQAMNAIANIDDSKRDALEAKRHASFGRSWLISLLSNSDSEDSEQFDDTDTDISFERCPGHGCVARLQPKKVESETADGITRKDILRERFSDILLCNVKRVKRPSTHPCLPNAATVEYTGTVYGVQFDDTGASVASAYEPYPTVLVPVDGDKQEEYFSAFAGNCA